MGEKKKVRISLSRLALLLFLVFVLPPLAFLIWVGNLPAPSGEELAEADRRNDDVRARLLEGAPAPAADVAAVGAEEAPAAELDSSEFHPQLPPDLAEAQKLADRLFLEMLETLELDIWPRSDLFGANLRRARELAGLHELGVRVSDEVRRGYRLEMGSQLGLIAHHMIRPEQSFIDSPREYLPRNPEQRREWLERAEESLKFLRVIEVPGVAFRYDALLTLFHPSVDGDGRPEPALPEVLAFDASLFVPQGDAGGRRIIASYLAALREERRYYTGLLHPAAAFAHKRRGLQAGDLNEFDDWPWYVGQNVVALGHAALAVQRDHPRRLNELMRAERQLLDLVEKGIRSEVGFEETFSWELNSLRADLQGRLASGAIGLLRGEPIPRKEEIGPGSPFFDPLLGAPYPMRKVAKSEDLVQLLWIIPQSYFPLTVTLEPDHPGLERYP